MRAPQPQCAICGKFVKVNEAVHDLELGDYGVVLSVEFYHGKCDPFQRKEPDMPEKITVWEFTNMAEDPMGFYAEEHVDKDEFIKAVNKDCIEKTGEPYPDTIEVSDVQHVYCKQEPVDSEQFDSDLSMDFSATEEDGDPMTIVYAQ